MVDQSNTQYGATTRTDDKVFDAGLRSYMMRVYNYMASGVLLTGIIAMVASTSPTILNMLYSPTGGYTGFGTLIAFSPLIFVLVMSFGINRMSSGTLQMLFWAFAAVMGLSLSSIFLVYTNESIARTFFITAATFGSLSLYGYTTKKSLSGWGTFLFMGLIGIIIASVVNMFMASSQLNFIISAAGVLIFAGLTAYDTQKIKQMYFHMTTGETRAKGAIMGALNLYLDFINLMLMLLRFMGDRR